jgi:hypothetical protein
MHKEHSPQWCGSGTKELVFVRNISHLPNRIRGSLLLHTTLLIQRLKMLKQLDIPS